MRLVGVRGFVLSVLVATLTAGCGNVAFDARDQPAGPATTLVPTGENAASLSTSLIETTFVLGPNEVVEAIRLLLPGDVLFEVDSAALSASAEQALAKVQVSLRGYPKASLLVEGHTDSDGSGPYNQALSQRRAESVAAWFAAHGVEPGRISSRGWGEDRPMAPNDSAESKSRNRRVELTIRARG